MKQLACLCLLIGLLVWLQLDFASLRSKRQEPLRFPSYPPSLPWK